MTSVDAPQGAGRSAEPDRLSRRGFVATVGGAAAAAAGGVLAATGGAAALQTGGDATPAAPPGPKAPMPRHERAYRIRMAAAERMRARPPFRLAAVSEEALYPNRIGSFAKGLPHDALGEVNPYAYEALLHAIGTGRAADFEDVPMGGPAKLYNPLGGLAFGLIGPDSHQMPIANPPAFASAEAAAEMGELYWQALARDIPFAAYDTHPTIAAAAADLAGFSDFRGRVASRISPETLFRAAIPGVTSGPFVSQFLLKDLPTGVGVATQAIRTALAGDHLTAYDDWLAAQDGAVPAAAASPIYDPTPRYVRNGRDLAEAVHWDWPGRSVHQAALIAFGFGTVSLAGVFAGATGVPFAPGNPYRDLRTQRGFATFGLPDATFLVAVATHGALKAAWYQKWFVHRRLRPEEFGGRVHHTVAGSAAYPVHADLLERSPVLGEIGRRFGSSLLPQAYPEGCPTHPAYPSGHATWAGAAVTVLKAFFDESALIANPVVAADDGLSVVPYAGPDADRMTLGGELNKLAWNIGVGRTFAGIHWRTDAVEGMRLGEAVAIGILRDVRETYGEEFTGFALTAFDGRRVTV